MQNIKNVVSMFRCFSSFLYPMPITFEISGFAWCGSADP